MLYNASVLLFLVVKPSNGECISLAINGCWTAKEEVRNAEKAVLHQGVGNISYGVVAIITFFDAFEERTLYSRAFY